MDKDEMMLRACERKNETYSIMYWTIVIKESLIVLIYLAASSKYSLILRLDARTIIFVCMIIYTHVLL